MASCAECGGDPVELDHFRAGRHTYAETRIFGTLRLFLCDSCMVDFGSFHSEFFALLWVVQIGYDKSEM